MAWLPVESGRGTRTPRCAKHARSALLARSSTSVPFVDVLARQDARRRLRARLACKVADPHLGRDFMGPRIGP